MVRLGNSAWICVLFGVLATIQQCSGVGLGVNWGTLAKRPMSPKRVVKLLKDNNFTKVKLFEPDDSVYEALRGSELEVMVAIPNHMLQEMQSLKRAKRWLSSNVSFYRRYNRLNLPDVNIAYIAVGNEPFLTGYNGAYVPWVLPAMQNLQQAIEDSWCKGFVKLVVPMNSDVLTEGTNRPSETTFKPDYIGNMTQIVSFLQQQGSPFVVNIYPYLSLMKDPDFPTSFAFFLNSYAAFDDEGYRYTNVLEASIDQVANALAQVGAPNMSIVLGEVGWPTNGEFSATPYYAQTFMQGLLNHLLQSKGTPRHPNTTFDFYLFSILDENAKSVGPGNFERHWGIFDYAGQAKYTLDLSGRGLEVPLVSANLELLEKQWCVLREEIDRHTNITKLHAAYNFSCSHGGDCTVLNAGGSCRSLPLSGMLSYALNNYYQAYGQADVACDFDWLAKVTDIDPTNSYNNTCKYPIANGGSSIPRVLNYAYALFAALLVLAVQLQV